MKRFSLWVLGLLVITGPALQAGEKKPEPPLSDRKILTLLHETNKAEVRQALHIKEHAAAENVRDYAAQLAKEHKRADSYVRALGGRLGIKLDKLDRTPVESADEQNFVQEAADANGDLLKTLEHQRTLLPKDSPVYALVVYLLPKIRKQYETASAMETTLAQSRLIQEVAFAKSSQE